VFLVAEAGPAANDIKGDVWLLPATTDDIESSNHGRAMLDEAAVCASAHPWTSLHQLLHIPYDNQTAAWDSMGDRAHLLVTSFAPYDSVPERTLVAQVMLLLSGANTPLFSTDTDVGLVRYVGRVQTSHMSHAALHHVMQRFAVAASHKLLLERFVIVHGRPDRSSGLCYHAFCGAIDVVVDEFERLLVQLQAPFHAKQSLGPSEAEASKGLHTLISLERLLQPCITGIETVSRFVQRLVFRSNGADAASAMMQVVPSYVLLDRLFEWVMDEDMLPTGERSAFDLSLRLFSATFKPYLRMIDLWCREGILSEKISELPIASKPECGHLRDIPSWTSAFELTFRASTASSAPHQETPKITESVAAAPAAPRFTWKYLSSIVSTGRCMALLRLLREEHPLLANADDRLIPLDDIDFSAKLSGRASTASTLVGRRDGSSNVSLLQFVDETLGHACRVNDTMMNEHIYRTFVKHFCLLKVIFWCHGA